MKNKYNITIFACFAGIFCQALVINYAPLLFVTFENSYNIPIEKISFLITLTFTIQLVIDILSARFIKIAGYKACACASQFFSFFGLILLGVLPVVMKDVYAGIIIAVFVYSIGAGMIEVVISPVMEACPSKKKSAAMSLLHSFYCWGHLAVVLVSTFFFYFFGIECWKVIAFLWSAIPLINFFVFIKAPIPDMKSEENDFSVKELVKNKIFLLLLAVMICGGASEQNMSQWASAFAEKGLGVSKTIGDLAGPCMFALLMGLSRLFYGIYRGKLKLTTFMLSGGILAVAGHIMAGTADNPFLGLLGCAITGIAVGIMWPGTLSLCAKNISGGTSMYSLLALCGDFGCISGPAVVGVVAGITDNINMGILYSSVFPVLFTSGILIFMKRRAARSLK